ncbi:MAG: GAF domain-containing protein [Fimbriimonadales bacterium]|nr:GAF domain-containing protein [Fimbriimonadales bacterium]
MVNSEGRIAGRVQPEWDGWLRRLQVGADPLALLNDVLEWARKQTAAQTALLLLPAQGGQGVDFTLVTGQGAEELHGLRLRPEETVLDDLLQKRLPWRYHNEGEQEPHSRGVRRGFKGLRAGVGVPLPGLPGGALVMVNQRQHEPFRDEDETLLNQIAPLFTMGLHLHALKQMLERREHELEWLRQLLPQMGEELSLQRVLQVVEPVLRAVSPLVGGLWLYNEEHTHLFCTLRYGAPLLPEAIDPATLPQGWQEAASTISTEHGLNLELLPLRIAGRTLGALMMGVREGELVGTEDGESSFVPCPLPLADLVGHIALLTGYALLHEQLARRAQHLATLYEFSLRLGEVRTIESWLELLAESARRLVPVDYCVIYFASGDGRANQAGREGFVGGSAEATVRRLQPVWVAPPEDTLLNHYPDAQYSLPGWVYAFNAPLAAPDLARHPQNLKEPLPGMFRSALAVPLQTAEQAFGVLTLLTTTPREFTLTEVEALFMLANFSALHLRTVENCPHA